MKTAGWILAILAMVTLTAMDASAMTVAGVGKGGFADFSKAIVFDTTSNPCPVNAETVTINGGGRACALTMKPVGDGSWSCSATVFAGASYKYYFEYRISYFEDTNGWKKAGPGGDRSQDNNRVRTITVPSAATSGYVFYNKFGDQDVRGKQGTPAAGDSWLTVKNPDLAAYNGTVDVSSSGNDDTTDMGAANAYGMSVVQTADTKVDLSWSFNISAADELAPTVEGAKEFDTQSTYVPYGFRVLRAKLPSGWATDTTNPNHLKFDDTVVNVVTGDTLWSPSRQYLGNSWYSNANKFTDTSLPTDVAVGDSFVYTVIWVDAYGDKSDTKDQNFSGGAKSWVRGGRTDVLFLVEHFDPNVVFPNGATEGRVRITPWVGGVPQPAYGFWSTAYLARRQTI